MQGTLFDIQEFAVHDGPGIRVTVFLKGCPLRCTWCHNPEGLDADVQVLRGAAGFRPAGFRIDADALAARLNAQALALRLSEGGVTFSGGEPLAQADFVMAVLDRLESLHVVLDTSGYADAATFARVAARVQLVHFDLKLMDPVQHRRWTGVDNARILENFDSLERLGVPYVVRVPMIPAVTDTEANLEAIARRVAGRPGLQRVELLPYNPTAGGKYGACGLPFVPGFDEHQSPKPNVGPFEALGILVRIV
ncbi:MAG: radical SAM protein [bacterium]